jgi:hypothetical protein
MRYKGFPWQFVILLALGSLILVSGCTQYTETSWNNYNSPGDPRVWVNLTLHDDNTYELHLANAGQDLQTGSFVISGYSTYLGKWEPMDNNHFMMDLSEVPYGKLAFSDLQHAEFVYDPHYPRINYIYGTGSSQTGTSVPVFYPDFATYKQNTPPVVSDGVQLPPGPVVHEIPVTG